MNAARWRAALRIARREAWRAKGRSLLVIALIGLPILALAGADIAYRTWQLSPTEKLARAIGTADAGIQWIGTPVRQKPSGLLGSDWASAGNADSAAPSIAQLKAQLPHGSRVLTERTAAQGAEVRTPAGLEYASMTGLDYADPIARGIVTPVTGRAPRTDAEAAVTSTLAAKADLHVGSTLELIDTNQRAYPTRTFTVVGIVHDSGYRKDETVYVQPSAISPPSAQERAWHGNTTWLIDSPGPITWQQVLQLNQQGYLVTSRDAYLHPPPASEITYQSDSSSIDKETLSVATLVVGMALLEVVLLAGPAFAVGARRQRRQLALIASTGGRSADLRNVVLANAIVLGAAAGVISIALGIVGMAIGIPTLGSLVDQVPGHFDVRPGELALLVIVAVLTALAAAAFPARAAARTDVVAALAGRRGALRTRKRVVVLGVVVGAIGAVIAIGGAKTSNGAAVILFGVALVELGLIACTPALIGWISRLGGRLPLAPRIALRDAGRNRSAAAPAVAAVMASIIGAMAAILVVASTTDKNRRDYHASLPMNAAWTALDSGLRGDGTEVDTQAVVNAMRATLPVAGTAAVRGPSQSCPLTEPNCEIGEIDFANPRWMERGGSRYTGGYLPSTIIDDGSGLKALFGKPEPAAVAALRAGKVVVVDQAAVGKDGTVRLTGSQGPMSEADGPAASKAKHLTVPAVVVSDGYPAVQLIVPPAVAAKLGVTPQDLGVFARDTRAPTDREKQALAGKLNAIDPGLYHYIESGYHDDRAWMMYGLVGVAALIAVGAAVIATALADVDGRADLVTLGAVGAAPRTRRVLSLSRAGVIAGIGAVLGTAAGFVPAVAWVRATRLPQAVYDSAGGYYAQPLPAQLHLVVPWLPTVAILFGIPLLAALLAGAFSRSRLPSERPASE
jgi:putative ABC transport system permease protein